MVLAFIAVAKYHEPPKYCTNRGHDEFPPQTIHYFKGNPQNDQIIGIAWHTWNMVKISTLLLPLTLVLDWQDPPSCSANWSSNHGVFFFPDKKLQKMVNHHTPKKTLWLGGSMTKFDKHSSKVKKKKKTPAKRATFPETNSSPLKIGHPKRKVVCPPSIFGYFCCSFQGG